MRKPEDEDPYASPEAQEKLQAERAANRREIEKLHPGNRLRLMMGLSLLPEGPTHFHDCTACSGEVGKITAPTKL